MNFGTKGYPNVKLFRIWIARHDDYRALAATASTTVLWQYYHEQARVCLVEAQRWVV